MSVFVLEKEDYSGFRNLPPFLFSGWVPNDEKRENAQTRKPNESSRCCCGKMGCVCDPAIPNQTKNDSEEWD